MRSRWDSLHRVQPDASSQPHASRKRVVATFPPLGETSNPYQRLLYEALAETGVRLAPSGKLRSKWLWENRREVGILHFHWLSGYYRHPRLAGQVVRLLLFAQRLLLARALRYRVVWTVHEIDPHDRQCRADSVAPRVAARFAQVLIVNDEATRGKVSRTLGREPVLIRHGSFAGVYAPARRPASDVRAELGVDDASVLILCFGLVRRYKRIEDVVEALALVPPDDRGLVVLVAGQVMDAELGDALRVAARDDPRIRLRLTFVPDDEVHELFSASDAVLVTRTDDGTSGVLALALSLGIPVVAADTPGYRELTAGASRCWRFTPGDPAALASVLVEAAAELSRARSANPRPHEDPLPSWREVAEQTAAALTG